MSKYKPIHDAVRGIIPGQVYIWTNQHPKRTTLKYFWWRDLTPSEKEKLLSLKILIPEAEFKFTEAMHGHAFLIGVPRTPEQEAFWKLHKEEKAEALKTKSKLLEEEKKKQAIRDVEFTIAHHPKTLAHIDKQEKEQLAKIKAEMQEWREREEEAQKKRIKWLKENKYV